MRADRSRCAGGPTSSTRPSPRAGSTEYMERKFGRDGRLKAIHDNLARFGAEVGLRFDFAKISRAPNTLDAHRLIRWATSVGVQREVVERLFRAYFVEGRNIGDRAVLIDIAAASGLDAAIVERLLAKGADADAVRNEIAQAQAIAVTSVPFFIFGGRLGVPGAQDVALLRRAMAQARAAMREARRRCDRRRPWALRPLQWRGSVREGAFRAQWQPEERRSATARRVSRREQPAAACPIRRWRA